MTDMRRTVLWVVFLASLFMLWDGWQKYNGHPSFFAPPVPKALAANAPAGSSSSVPAAVPGAAGVAAVAASAPAGVSEKVTIKTDVLIVTVDSLGGDITRVELPKFPATLHEPSLFDPLLEAVGFRKRPDFTPTPTVLLDSKIGYTAQSGLLTAGGGAALPTHNTPMSVVPGPREMASGTDAVSLRLESPEV